MKKIIQFLAGFLWAAAIFSIAGAFIGYRLAHATEPVVIVHNSTNSPISSISIETDMGESYRIEEIPINQSRRVEISKRDKGLWITYTNSTGNKISSKQIYVTSSGTVFGVVSESGVYLDYTL